MAGLPDGILERPFQRRVVAYARRHRWKVVAWHASLVSVEQTDDGPIYTYGTAVSGDAKDFPDLSLYRAGDVPIFAELKSQRGRVRQGQLDWLDLLDACGMVAVMWRPSDWESIKEILR